MLTEYLSVCFQKHMCILVFYYIATPESFLCIVSAVVRHQSNKATIMCEAVL